MLGQFKIVVIIGLLIMPMAAIAQEMGESDSSIMESDTSIHDMAMEMSAALMYETEGDSLHSAFDTDGALEAYLKANKEEPENTTYIWKIVREYADKGIFADDDDEMEAAYTEGEIWARKCVAMAPEDGNCHLYLSIAVGRIAESKSGKTKVKLSREVNEEAARSIELNPNLDGAYHVLGRWNREVVALPWYLKAAVSMFLGGLPPATNDEAVKNFNMAIELRPDRMLHYFELGVTYKYMGEKEKAKTNFEKTLSMDLVERKDESRQEEAKKFLSKL